MQLLIRPVYLEGRVIDKLNELSLLNRVIFDSSNSSSYKFVASSIAGLSIYFDGKYGIETDISIDPDTFPAVSFGAWVLLVSSNGEASDIRYKHILIGIIKVLT